MDASIFTATKKLAIDLSIIDGMCWQYVVLYFDSRLETLNEYSLPIILNPLVIP